MLNNVTLVGRVGGEPNVRYFESGSPEFDPDHRRLNAATKRASMDLTKALPALRKTNNG